MWAKRIYCNSLNRREPNNTSVGTNELLQISKVVGPVLQLRIFSLQNLLVVWLLKSMSDKECLYCGRALRNYYV